MLTLLVPILITYLLEPPSLKTAKRPVLQLHEQALQWLKKVVPKYPEVRNKQSHNANQINLPFFVFQEFKTIMTQSPALKVKLEQAIRNSQLISQTNSQLKQASLQKLSAPNPTIKLKTDFSNFS